MNNTNIPNQERSHPAFNVHRVLNKGFIRLIDCMPNPCDPNFISADDAICQMARVSYGTGTEKKRNNDGLINYLMEHRHTSPFEGVVFKFHVKMPIFVARQWFRHRTASANEISARYSVLSDDFYIPEESRCQGQDINMKQGSKGALEDGAKIISMINVDSQESYFNYEELLKMGLSRELARSVLPVNIYTEMYWMMNLHNLLHFVKLRISSHAQYEIRVYAEKIKEIIKEVAPATLLAWETHIENGINLSSVDAEFLREFSNIDLGGIKSKMEELGWSVRKIESTLEKLHKLF
ncbi:thymidylate synthase (FAD) [Candidatus Pacearchaeota archaeon]|nr:thymidylate synthase (FAD) [Candidatus Pacearchaeota archaeon]|tara:strand:- start:4247 stop:5128 length:882 start_codon:yes stop_codon:yes gene_type:complete